MASQPVAKRRTEFSEQQQAFIREMVMGTGDRLQAAKVAGYADPYQAGWYQMQQSRVVEEIKNQRHRLIEGDGACLALRTMKELMLPGNPGGVRFQAAKYFLDAAGHGAKGDEGREKSLSEMSAEELATAIAKLDDAYAKLADGAKPVPTVIENGQGTNVDNAG